MSKVSCVSGGKAPQVPLRMARAELLHFFLKIVLAALSVQQAIVF